MSLAFQQYLRDPVTGTWHVLQGFALSGAVRLPQTLCSALLTAPAPVPGPRPGEARCPLCFAATLVP